MDKTVIKSFITMAITILFAFLPSKAQATSEWTVNPADYRYDMSLYFDMTLGATGEHVDLGKYEIASFVNDECRGVADFLPNVEGCLYMRIRSNQETGEKVTFKIRNRTSGEITNVEGISLTFESDKAIGMPSNPHQIVVRRYFDVTIQASEGGSVIFDNGSYEEGTTLDITAVPDEGYHFVAWSDGNTEASRTITVSDNINIEASFEANIYKLTYMVDGEVYKTFEIAYGSAITPEAAPEKEGYTFTAWEGLPETMPAHDVNAVAEYKANVYKLTYMVDGEVYKTFEIAYGSAITPEAAPEKEGYTFTAWEGLPETMPAHDVNAVAEYNANVYKLTYMVDGEVYKTLEIAYGSAITPEAAPEKEGYTFTAWEGLPETMPSHDVNAVAEYKANIYKLTYMVDGEVYKTVEIAYGSAITPEAAPEKEGYTFTAWEGLPETMPSHDVNAVAEYKANTYKLTVYLDGEIYYEAELETGATIDIPEPQLPETQVFDGWVEEVPATMPAHDLEIHGTTSLISSIGTVIADENVATTIYSMTGRLLFKNITIEEASQKLPHGIYIVNGRKMVLGQK